uniref:Ribosomal protein S11 n=1 Tax=Laminaria rodriguezii TaxID=1740620 RepID=A0A7U1AQG6_9PHAE|nr:ribosomal protein S11 [Laminaria rodriguezii]QQY84988.1 ribosomal protein S11 [Laminaria rodriguezii]
MLVKIDNINLFLPPVKTSVVNTVQEEVLENQNKSLLKKNKDKKGVILIKSTKRNVFCTLLDTNEKKVKTSCSLRVPAYKNEYNERENLYMRGLLLGNLFGDKVIELGYTEFTIYLGSGINKGRRGVVRGLNKKGVKITFLHLGTRYPHNGCRPVKVCRKKFRTKPKISR